MPVVASRTGRRSASLLAAAALLFCGCECRNPPAPRAEQYDDDEQRAHIEVETEPPTEIPPAIGSGRFRPRPEPDRERGPPPVLEPGHGDEDWANDEPAIARRYVYRVRMIVPSWLGSGGTRLAAPAAELFVDVAHERLRARFVGPGWPVPSGSEVRIRRDRPGAYLYDARGGRPLRPGELAAWFEGGELTRRGPPLRIFGTYGHSRREVAPDDEEVPGELICAFIAEWAGESRESQARRCDLGAPYLFRLAFWRAERTAGLPVPLPRNALRADEAGPPRYIEGGGSDAFLERDALARMSPSESLPPAPERPPPRSDDRRAVIPDEGLRVFNESATRVIVTAEGVALGWVDAGADALFVGFRPGLYEVGSMRPLGAVVQRGRLVPVPGVHRVCDGRCPRLPARPEEPEPAPVASNEEPPEH